MKQRFRYIRENPEQHPEIIVWANLRSAEFQMVQQEKK